MDTFKQKLEKLLKNRIGELEESLENPYSFRPDIRAEKQEKIDFLEKLNSALFGW